MSRHIATGGLAALLLAIASPALAGDIPGDASTKATLQVTNVPTLGVIERRLDRDWYKVRLTKGQDYAVRIVVEHGDGTLGSVTLRDPAQRPLKSAAINTYGDDGFEIRAPRTGTYFVDVEGDWEPEDSGPKRYGVAVVRDCRDAPDTRCTLAPGRTYSVGSAWSGDHDRYVQPLDGSKRYTFAAVGESDNDSLTMELLDGNGDAVTKEQFGSGSVVVSDFAPPRSGRYYVRAYCNAEDDYGCKYKVGMTVR